MRKRLHKLPNAEVNVAPLVDVLLILLVILLLAMPTFHKRAPVDLPSTALTGEPSPVAAVRLFVGRDGALYLDDNKVDISRALAKVTENSSVELGADKDVKYSDLMHLMAALQARKPRELSLVTR